MKNSSLHIIVALLLLYALESCIFVVADNDKNVKDTLEAVDSSHAKVDTLANVPTADTAASNELSLPEGHINTGNTQPQQVVAFAKTLMGTPYKYASIDPQVGFDCSGFITYVFNHFNIVVPRSSIDFTNVGTEVSAMDAKPGDLILFTGTNPEERFVGHMGIIVENLNGGVQFIHSTSGKAYGVTITPLNEGYKNRYVKTIRIFPQNDHLSSR